MQNKLLLFLALGKHNLFTHMGSVTSHTAPCFTDENMPFDQNGPGNSGLDSNLESGTSWF